ncbi:MAG: hypothetical protein WCG47_11185 [Dermatophilaceae bacterium]
MPQVRLRSRLVDHDGNTVLGWRFGLVHPGLHDPGCRQPFVGLTLRLQARMHAVLAIALQRRQVRPVTLDSPRRARRPGR